MKQFTCLLRDPRPYLGLCLFGLCLYSYVVTAQLTDTIPKIVANPEAWAGWKIELGSDAKVIQVQPKEFQVEQARTRIVVRIPENLQREWQAWRQQLQPGDYVSLRAVVQSGGFFLLQDMHIHKGRMLKVWVSLAAVLSLVGILIHEHKEGNA